MIAPLALSRQNTLRASFEPAAGPDGWRTAARRVVVTRGSATLTVADDSERYGVYDAYEQPYYGQPEDEFQAPEERVAQLEQQVAAMNREREVEALTAEFPEFASEQAALALVQTADQIAQRWDGRSWRMMSPSGGSFTMPRRRRRPAVRASSSRWIWAT